MSLVGRSVVLAMVCGLLLLALWDPGWSAQRRQLDALLVVDITQSMDTEDLPGPGPSRPLSRLQAVRQALVETLQRLPCGSRIGLGVFTEYRSLVLLAPLEVCEHFAELRDSIAALDSRMAWSGNSEVTKGLHGSLLALATLEPPPALVFISDGHEAPPMDPRAPPPWNGRSGQVPGLVVGVGGDQPVPIPRHDPEGRPLGHWGANDVRQSAGRILNPNDPANASDVAPAMPGATPGREHLSALREPHLQALARQTGLAYHRLQDADRLREALLSPALAHEVPGRASLRTPATLLAGLLWLGLLCPDALRHRVMHGTWWRVWRRRSPGSPASTGPG